MPMSETRGRERERESDREFCRLRPKCEKPANAHSIDGLIAAPSCFRAARLLSLANALAAGAGLLRHSPRPMPANTAILPDETNHPPSHYPRPFRKSGHAQAAINRGFRVSKHVDSTMLRGVIKNLQSSSSLNAPRGSFTFPNLQNL